MEPSRSIIVSIFSRGCVIIEALVIFFFSNQRFLTKDLFFPFFVWRAILLHRIKKISLGREIKLHSYWLKVNRVLYLQKLSWNEISQRHQSWASSKRLQHFLDMGLTKETRRIVLYVILIRMIFHRAPNTLPLSVMFVGLFIKHTAVSQQPLLLMDLLFTGCPFVNIFFWQQTF